MNKDTIYRQDFDKFLEDAEKEAVKNRKYVFASALNTIRGNLKIFPSAQPEQHWIPCSERLPDIDERAITLYSNGNISGAKYIGCRAWLVDFPDEDASTSIIAWMPPPESYKEE